MTSSNQNESDAALAEALNGMSMESEALNGMSMSEALNAEEEYEGTADFVEDSSNPGTFVPVEDFDNFITEVPVTTTPEETKESVATTAGPSAGSTIPEYIQITVKTLNGQTIAMEINPLSPVSVLQEKISAKLGIAPSEQRLIFSGKQLDPIQPLSAYNIQENSMITLVLRLKGGD